MALVGSVSPVVAPASDALARGRRVIARIIEVSLEGALVWATIAVVGGDLLAVYRRAESSPAIVSGVKVAGVDVAGWSRDQLKEHLRQQSDAFAAAPIELSAGDVQRVVPAGELGAALDVEKTVDQATRIGHLPGSPFQQWLLRRDLIASPIHLGVARIVDEARARETLTQLAPEFSVEYQPGRIDFDSRIVRTPHLGQRLAVDAALFLVSDALRAGEDEVAVPVVSAHLGFAGQETAVGIDSQDLAVVVARYETTFRSQAQDRARNLSLAAAALDGVVLLPGAEFSFNETVGERSFAAGYRQATGISGGELVDVVGGGVCQVASTLFAAAMMAGVDVVSATPHSRPSSYIELGLDTTVVWPNVDLRLKNSYSYPLTVHTRVADGSVVVELFARKPSDRVVFRRQTLGRTEHARRERIDPTLATGQIETRQWGADGYEVERVREIWRNGAIDRTDRWVLHYPPTDEIVVVGANSKGRSAKAAPSHPITPPASFSAIASGDADREDSGAVGDELGL